MAFSHLSRERILMIRQAFIDAQLSYRAELRSLLLAGINHSYVASLRQHSSDQFQLNGDLNSLNSVERLEDGTVPLRAWLENAAEQFTPLIQAQIFARALDDLRAGGTVQKRHGSHLDAGKSAAQVEGCEIEIKQSRVFGVTLEGLDESVVSYEGEGINGLEEMVARNDIVNLGFASHSEADKFLSKNQPLQCSLSYYFWLNIGNELKESIGAAQPLHIENLPSEAHLKVALFAFEGGFDIRPGEDVGELRIGSEPSRVGEESKTVRPASARVRVSWQPTQKRPEPVGLSPDAAGDILDQFLFFPVRAPETEGTHRLRCNIYCGQVLLQSHLVSATIMRKPTKTDEALGSRVVFEVDYSLSQALRPGYLAAIEAEPHRLSLMINSNGDGSHNFRFFGADGEETFKDDAHIDGPQLEGFLKQARRAMRKVSWGNEEEWDECKEWKYRYKQEVFDPTKLAKDLAYLARAGWRIYAGFLAHLKTTAQSLEQIMSHSGMVQIALKLSPRAVLPASVIYDYPWKPDQYDDFDNTPFELCPTFAAAIKKAGNGGPPLDESDCFKGGCYLKSKIDEITEPGSSKTLLDLPKMICPSGFWGYRHALGLPLTLDGTNSEAPQVISFEGALRMIAGVSTDPDFVERDPHLNRLKVLTQTMTVQRDEDYNNVVKHLKTTVPHLLYFYCHGGTRANTNLPYLEIGKNDRFGPEDLIGERISWKDIHPLVFINGCHTTSLNPEITLDFVSSFVQQGGAGVIGTEITIFEELAVRFAEECLGRFLGAKQLQGVPIGKAVRGARLELLRRGNPLGLVYIPFAIASLRMQQIAGN
jgi:hypothetical protein